MEIGWADGEKKGIYNYYLLLSKNLSHKMFKDIRNGIKGIRRSEYVLCTCCKLFRYIKWAFCVLVIILLYKISGYLYDGFLGNVYF